jgi:hypothetical protein
VTNLHFPWLAMSIQPLNNRIAAQRANVSAAVRAMEDSAIRGDSVRSLDRMTVVPSVSRICQRRCILMTFPVIGEVSHTGEEGCMLGGEAEQQKGR